MANSADRLAAIQRVMNGIKKPHSLYDSLHRVGDDCIKADIEEILGDLLDPATMDLVRRVFHVATDEDAIFDVIFQGFAILVIRGSVPLPTTQKE